MLLACPKGYLNFLNRGNSERQPGQYRQIIAAYAIRPPDVVLRLSILPNQRTYTLPYAQEIFCGPRLQVREQWEDRLTRWTVGVQNALGGGEALPRFPTAASGPSDPKPCLRCRERAAFFSDGGGG